MKLTVDKSSGKWFLAFQTINYKDSIEIQAPDKGVLHWYPFNINYEYRAHLKEDKLVLFGTGGMTTSKIDRFEHKDIIIDLQSSTWYNRDVYERNMATMTYAHDLGLHTPYAVLGKGGAPHKEVKDSQAYRYWRRQLAHDFTIVSDNIERIKTLAHILNTGPHEDIFSVSQHGEDAVVEELMKTLSTEDEEELLRLGEIYGMLSLIRKMKLGG